MIIEWNVDPVILSVGPLSPRWYGVLFASAFMISYQIMKRIFDAEGKTMKQLDQLTIAIIAGTILGARFGHVLFYEPQILIQDPAEVIAIWHGGLASHGGALGIIAALWWFHKKNPTFGMTWLFDRLAIVAAISGMCIRLGNLMNSEIIGKPTDGTWGFWFQRIDPLLLPRHPTQLYEAALCLALFGLTYWMYHRGIAEQKPGRIFGLFLVLLFFGRFLVEFNKEHQVDFESALPIDMGQILSIPFIALGAYYLLRGTGPTQA
ncbi:MAG: prolipoprotein diacylglyceryl transferase [Ignavibacteria bacterium]|nr:prolipoprotein diacylglyceryl transferase [Ignavibacteria bacterium]